MNIKKLSSLKEGESCRIKELNIDGKMRSRLMDLGMTYGSEVECLHISSGGDPAAYLICGAVIAIRKKDASEIVVTAF
ncbi:MAG: ferrous iron transport protein A [Ruminococcus flavefaciens]|nr:ferrous iron transport protein A [Ruminococcus flavefaciens]MCM1061909.1 ferrous iron transport protein A [Eubacterium sp.]MCM1269094.1 ferrous iron transport protein A [Ruminococcus flavefaciens]MCM1361070.1 ferrous iron transport protein A [Clostridiales bacterium]MCM1434592.1 ferrous iron transport protein A [Ruminococcus flavefaciens]